VAKIFAGIGCVFVEPVNTGKEAVVYEHFMKLEFIVYWW
jgi:hypothetical protein